MATPGTERSWETCTVEVFRRTAKATDLDRIFQYERNYRLLDTFEPFRQGDREFALISTHYQATAVLDLSSGKVIAHERLTDRTRPGFCPVGFYVPDWWDLSRTNGIPGGKHWTADDEWPTGDFGFVWGCEWGDDSSWKVQYLDLSTVSEGFFTRDERFGYVELATTRWQNPCLSTDPPEPNTKYKPPFINISRYNGNMKVSFSVPIEFDLTSGECFEWERLRVANLE